MQIERLVLYSDHIPELLEFYRNGLDMQVQAVEQGFRIQLENSVLEFLENNTSIYSPSYHFALTIPSNKIEEAAGWLKKRISLLWIPDHDGFVADFKSWNAKSVYFTDPSGNIVEFIARFDLDNPADPPFSSSQISSISEVGLVFPPAHFSEAVDEFMRTYGLSYFNKQPPLEQFRVIGDDSGLFIVVPEYRNWYPSSGKQAAVSPLEVTFRQDDQRYKIEMKNKK